MIASFKNELCEGTLKKWKHNVHIGSYIDHHIYNFQKLETIKIPVYWNNLLLKYSKSAQRTNIGQWKGTNHWYII